MRRRELFDRIEVAECVEFMRGSVPDGAIDLILTSPPYDNLRDYDGYTFDFEAIASQMYRVLADGGVAVWVVGDKINGGRTLTSFRHAIGFEAAGFSVHDVMIYRKKNTPFMRKNAYTNCYEMMFVLAKGRPKTFNPIMQKTVRSGVEMLVANKGADGVNRKVPAVLNKEKVRANIWEYAVGLGGTTNDRFAFEHPAMFPEALARDHILSWSNAGDLVYDPMCGAGTTLKMAASLDRRYLGTDVSAKYAELSEKRVSRIAANTKLVSRGRVSRP